jgi:hypothetical protein
VDPSVATAHESEDPNGSTDVVDPTENRRELETTSSVKESLKVNTNMTVKVTNMA